MGVRCILVKMVVFGNISCNFFLNQDLQDFEDIFGMLDFDDQQRFYFTEIPYGRIAFALSEKGSNLIFWSLHTHLLIANMI